MNRKRILIGPQRFSQVCVVVVIVDGSNLDFFREKNTNNEKLKESI